MQIPEDFAAGVLQERGAAGQLWLAELPHRLDHYCRLWSVQLEGPPWHGYLGLVWPVSRGAQKLALKLTWVDLETAQEAAALRHWAGKGAVRLLEDEPGALLLERLQAGQSLDRQPLEAALEVSASLLRRLSIPATPEFLEMGAYTRELFALARARWSELGKPFAEEWLLPPPDPARDLLVNQDLHYANVLAGEREPWLVIDPKPLRGDPEFALAPLLWNRFEEGKISERFEQLVRLAGLDRQRALKWSCFRVMEYWLWALHLGLTQDPRRCSRLMEELTALHQASP